MSPQRLWQKTAVKIIRHHNDKEQRLIRGEADVMHTIGNAAMFAMVRYYKSALLIEYMVKDRRGSSVQTLFRQMSQFYL